MGPSPCQSHFLKLGARLENSSFIIHGELLEFRIFSPNGTLMSSHLFSTSPYLKLYNSHTFLLNNDWKYLRSSCYLIVLNDHKFV